MHRLTAVLVLASGCTTPPEDIRVVESAESVDCPEADCGMNSEYMGGYFSTLKLGAWNGDRLTRRRFILREFIHPVPQVHLEVDGDHFVPVDIFGGAVPGAGVKDTILVVENELGVAYNIRIAAVHHDARFWAKSSGEAIETYELEYAQLDENGDLPHDGYHPFCRFEPLAGHPAVFSDAVAFEGELYDPVTKEIVETEEGSGWFNLSCLGSAPAKMFMMRHTIASSNEGKGVTTTHEERQAFLNAWTGNYCGDGRSFTRTGEDLLIRDHKGWIAKDSGWSWPDFENAPMPFKSYEAIWNETGAVCLDEPRRADSDARVYNDIQTHCMTIRNTQRPIPRCTGATGNWQTRGHLLTVNPSDS